jgi:hypothetical protein
LATLSWKFCPRFARCPTRRRIHRKMSLQSWAPNSSPILDLLVADKLGTSESYLR